MQSLSRLIRVRCLIRSKRETRHTTHIHNGVHWYAPTPTWINQNCQKNDSLIRAMLRKLETLHQSSFSFTLFSTPLRNLYTLHATTYLNDTTLFRALFSHAGILMSKARVDFFERQRFIRIIVSLHANAHSSLVLRALTDDRENSYFVFYTFNSLFRVDWLYNYSFSWLLNTYSQLFILDCPQRPAVFKWLYSKHHCDWFTGRKKN